MSQFDIRTANLRAINSMTKYPSIPTYHTLDPKNGNLLDETVEFTGMAYASEKIDGTNARIVLLPDKTYLIGSRDELLYASGDLLANPALGIVDAVRAIADGLAPFCPPSQINGFFGEVYGHKIGKGAKQYTKGDEVGFRLFDVLQVNDFDEVMAWPAERIAAWRDGGGQRFVPEAGLEAIAHSAELELTPRLFEMPARDLPRDLEGMRNLLTKYLPQTFAGLGDTEGRAEGAVLRTWDRSTIAKARFQDYDRTLKRRTSAR